MQMTGAAPQRTDPACSGDASALAAEFAQVAEELAVLLARHIQPGGFPDRTYYGEAFALWLWTRFADAGSEDATEHALAAVLARDPDASHAHHEFNNLALLHYFAATGDERALPPLAEMRVRDNHVPNWAFLRTYGRLLHNRTFGEERFDERRLEASLKRLLAHEMRPYGLICDTRYLSKRYPTPCFDRPVGAMLNPLMHLLKRGTSESAVEVLASKLHILVARSTSFMYHCFDLSSLCGTLSLTDWEVAEDALRRGVDFISDFVLRSGDAIYIGRGQQQLLAYGALIFSLSFAAARWGEERYLAAAKRAFRHVVRHRRADGTLPLVVREGERGWPDESRRAASPEHPGWYRYNNFYDYEPAIGLFLARAAEALRKRPQLSAAAPDGPAGLSIYGHEMAIWRDDLWEAVLSVPGGYWANALPMPYICVQGTSVTPCYGGDRIPPSLYSAEVIPLPQAVARSGRRICLADELHYRIHGDGERVVMEGRVRGIRHERSFLFGRGAIEVTDRLSLAQLAARGLSAISPLVAWGLQMEPLGDCEWRIHDKPVLTLQAEGTEGQLEPQQGYCARGPIVGVRETLSPGRSARTFERTMTIALA